MSIFDDIEADLEKTSGKKKYRLSNLELTEISLVDNGANQFADVLLMKRDTSNEISNDQIDAEIIANMFYLEKRERQGLEPELTAKAEDEQIPDDVHRERRRGPTDGANTSNAYQREKDTDGDTLNNLRSLLEQMDALLNPVNESERMADADIQQADETPTPNAAAEREVDRLQSARDAYEDNRDAYNANIARPDAEEILDAMSRLASALSHKPMSKSATPTIPGLTHSPPVRHTIPNRFHMEPINPWRSDVR